MPQTPSLISCWKEKRDFKSLPVRKLTMICQLCSHVYFTKVNLSTSKDSSLKWFLTLKSEGGRTSDLDAAEQVGRAWNAGSVVSAGRRTMTKRAATEGAGLRALKRLAQAENQESAESLIADGWGRRASASSVCFRARHLPVGEVVDQILPIFNFGPCPSPTIVEYLKELLISRWTREPAEVDATVQKLCDAASLDKPFNFHAVVEVADVFLQNIWCTQEPGCEDPEKDKLRTAPSTAALACLRLLTRGIAHWHTKAAPAPAASSSTPAAGAAAPAAPDAPATSSDAAPTDAVPDGAEPAAPAAAPDATSVSNADGVAGGSEVDIGVERVVEACCAALLAALQSPALYIRAPCIAEQHKDEWEACTHPPTPKN